MSDSIWSKLTLELLVYMSESDYILARCLLKKAMATHSSTLTWKIPGTGEPGGLPSMESHRVGHD